MNRQQKIEDMLKYLGPLFLEKKWKIAVAESCSGGGIAYHITKVPGSSSWFKYSVVTYTDEAKQELLGINEAILIKHSAVSTACALAMVAGLDKKCARVAVTGYSGPDGDDVGRVFIAFAPPQGQANVLSFHFAGHREDIQEQAIFEALKCLIEMAWSWESESQVACFFALGAMHRELELALMQQALKAGIPYHQQEPVSNLHLTIAYLGHQSQKQLETLLQQGTAFSVQGAAYELSFNKLMYLERADAWVFGFDNLVLPLVEMQRFFSGQDFLPHVSISKRCGLAINPDIEEFNIPWMINSYGLYISFHGIFYKLIKIWHLEHQK